jgi:hypothetical protein
MPAKAPPRNNEHPVAAAVEAAATFLGAAGKTPFLRQALLRNSSNEEQRRKFFTNEIFMSEKGAS